MGGIKWGRGANLNMSEALVLLLTPAWGHAVSLLPVPFLGDACCHYLVG